MIRKLILACLLVLMASPVFAVNPDEMLDDPALESRARHLSTELRCLVCQNQSIDDSSADLARDLRVLLRERLEAGDSDRAVMDYLVSRYGEFVLLRPRFSVKTLILWSAPVVFLLIGGVVLALSIRKSGKAHNEQGLTDDEKAKIDRLINES